MRTLSDADTFFQAKGATHYHDFQTPVRYSYGVQIGGVHMFRHYFRNGVEIGYVTIPLLELGISGQTFDPPRVWNPMPRLDPMRVV